MTSNYKRLATTKREVNARRCNRISLQRKLRLASFVAAPRLIKGFHNKPKIVT